MNTRALSPPSRGPHGMVVHASRDGGKYGYFHRMGFFAKPIETLSAKASAKIVLIVVKLYRVSKFRSPPDARVFEDFGISVATRGHSRDGTWQPLAVPFSGPTDSYLAVSTCSPRELVTPQMSVPKRKLC